ncbi:uncharacterized protein LOC142632316 isoform X2 [Castanea sativa]|uniref:uncharacterized protein LOC142632316 isoform X2 n=1 Tax=Castanea sativa TaxID=21020 RepID=UPI003F650B11
MNITSKLNNDELQEPQQAHLLLNQLMEFTRSLISVQGRDGGEIDRDFDLTPHIGRTGGTTVEGQEASSSRHNGGSGARSGSDESGQSTGSGGTDTNEGISRRVGGNEHDEADRDEGNDEDRRRVGELESGTRRRVRNSSNMTLVATFITVAVQSTSAIFALSLGELSPLAQKLFTAVLVTNLVGFLCLYVVLFPSRYISRRAAEILGGVGAAAAAIGFLLMMGIKLSLRIIILACLVVLAASVLSFMP